MIRTVSRVMSPDEASTLVNDDAPDLKPSPIDPGDLLVDADTGKPILALDAFPEDSLGAFRRAVLDIPQNTSVLRTSGQRNTARTIGFLPRAAFIQARGSCRVCATSYEAPEAHRFLCDSASTLWAMMSDRVPAGTEATARAAEQILPDWRLGDTAWTSGIVNKTSALMYHRDRNNGIGAWSAMVVVRRNTRGGHLHLPEYDVVIPCRDGAVVMFPGPEIVHGVTPIDIRPDGYRYSVVYYSVAKMAHCLPPDEELADARQSRTNSAITMLDRQREQGFLA